MTCTTNRPDRERDYQPFPHSGPLARNMNLPLSTLRRRVNGQAAVYCYIIASVKNRDGQLVQTGCGPNFQGGLITLCTCGDPTPPQAGLQRLERGDMLIFYCGLQGWGFDSAPALYLMGYFEIEAAGKASDFDPADVQRLFARNFHVRHPNVYAAQKERLVLVKGSPSSRLLNKAVLISAPGTDGSGKPLKVLSPQMQEVFGCFGGKIGFQRSPTRWVDADRVQRAAEFMRSLD